MGNKPEQTRFLEFQRIYSESRPEDPPMEAIMPNSASGAATATAESKRTKFGQSGMSPEALARMKQNNQLK